MEDFLVILLVPGWECHAFYFKIHPSSPIPTLTCKMNLDAIDFVQPQPPSTIQYFPDQSSSDILVYSAHLQATHAADHPESH